MLACSCLIKSPLNNPYSFFLFYSAPSSFFGYWLTSTYIFWGFSYTCSTYIGEDSSSCGTYAILLFTVCTNSWGLTFSCITGVLLADKRSICLSWIKSARGMYCFGFILFRRLRQMGRQWCQALQFLAMYWSMKSESLLLSSISHIWYCGKRYLSFLLGDLHLFGWRIVYKSTTFDCVFLAHLIIWI